MRRLKFTAGATGQSITPESADRYRYFEGDLEPVRPSQIQVGDLLAHAGKPGTRRFSADRVVFTGYAGNDRYRIEFDSPYGRGHINQPESIPLSRVRAGVQR